jgi:hypothetical protein
MAHGCCATMKYQNHISKINDQDKVQAGMAVVMTI